VKCNGKVIDVPSQFYPRWRARSFAAETLREADEVPPRERLLQQIWLHQRLQRESLHTLQGMPIRVLHPGFWNQEAGPDFRQAVLQFGNDRPVAGDVEIDIYPSAWRGHGHDRNPAYRGVILHVVWCADPDEAGPLPTLAIKLRLDAPMNELRQWLGTEPGFPVSLAGHCSAPLRALSESAQQDLLRQAAQVRLEGKGNALAARARQVGWEQSLWEGLFGALGFKHNIWPMRRLAEVLPALTARESVRQLGAFALQARMLGVSGLLPTDLTRRWPGTDRYLRRVWDSWWRECEEFAGIILPESLWRFGGLRPANQPHRRVALAAHWLASENLPERLEHWFTATLPDRRLESSLLDVLQAGIDDDFWSCHWTLRSRRMQKPQPLLGPQRVTDLAVNVILPWFHARAVSGRTDALRRIAEHRYFAWPRAQDNATLRLARQRLLGGKESIFLKTAAMQQGLLQIVRDFCEQSNALCENCQFPQLVRELGAGRS